MSNKSTQFAQNTSIAKQNLRNGKTIDYAKNLAEFRNVISYIDAQLKESKDNPLIIKTCQNLIRTISGLDLPADVKRHELAVAPSSVQKLYQQMTQSKNGNSSSSKLRQEAMHNAVQQSLKEQIANLHNMSKAERMELYKRLMTAKSLQEAINNGFIVNDEYVDAFMDKAKTDAQRLEYLKNRAAELEEKRRNGTITQTELRELEQVQAELPKAEEEVKNNKKTAKVVLENAQNVKGDLCVQVQCLAEFPDSSDLTMRIWDVNNTSRAKGNQDDLATRVGGIGVSSKALRGEGNNGLVDIDYNNLGFVFDTKLAVDSLKDKMSRNITGVTNSVNASFDNVLVDVSRAGNFNSDMLDVTGNESTGSFLEALTSPKGVTGTNFASTFIENHNVDKVANEKVGENFATLKTYDTTWNLGNTINLSSAQKNEFTEENNVVVGGREELLAMFANRTDINAKEVFNLNTAGYEFNNIPQTSSANLDYVEKDVRIAELQEKVKNGSVTQEERQELEQVQLEMVKANQRVNENKYISSFIQVNTQPEPVKTDENTEEHNKPIQNNEADVQAFIQNNASFGLEEVAMTAVKKDYEEKSFNKSDFWKQMDKTVLSSYKKVIEEKSGINKAVSKTDAKSNKTIEVKKESMPNKPSAGKTEQKNDLASSATAKPNKATEPKKESSLNKTLANNTEQKNDLASNTAAKPNKATEPKKETTPNKPLANNTEQKNDLASSATTQTSDITENKNDIFNKSFAPTTDVTSYDVPTNFTLADSSGQQSSSLTDALSAASYNPYDSMMPSFGNAR